MTTFRRGERVQHKDKTFNATGTVQGHLTDKVAIVLWDAEDEPEPDGFGFTGDPEPEVNLERME